MAKYGREGHRSRIRNAYITNGAETMSDVHIVELFLSLLIPRKMSSLLHIHFSTDLAVSKKSFQLIMTNLLRLTVSAKILP